MIYIKLSLFFFSLVGLLIVFIPYNERHTQLKQYRLLEEDLRAYLIEYDLYHNTDIMNGVKVSSFTLYNNCLPSFADFCDNPMLDKSKIIFWADNDRCSLSTNDILKLTSYSIKYKHLFD